MRKLAIVAAGIAALAGTAVAGPAQTWTPVKDAKWTPLDPNDKTGKGPAMTVVFGDPSKKGEPIGFMLKLPPGFKPGPHTHTSDDYAVIVQGTVHNFKARPGKNDTMDLKSEGPALTAGGSWFQPGGDVHDNECEKSSKDGCIVFVYMAKGFDFIPATGAAEGKADKDKKPAKPAKDAKKP